MGSFTPLHDFKSLCPSWEVVFPVCALGVGGKTILGKGYETRKAGIGEQQSFSSRAITSLYRSSVQIRRCLFLQADLIHTQVCVDEQSEG